MSALFDEQVAKSSYDPRNGMTLEKVYEFIASVYDHRNADGSLPFNTIDYYGMEDIGAFLKATSSALSAAEARCEKLEAAAGEAQRAIETSMDILKNPAFAAGQNADLAYQRLWDWWDKQDQKRRAAAALAGGAKEE